MAAGKRILVLTRNLFFLPRIQNAAAPYGLQVAQVENGERLREECKTGDVALVLVDLEGDRDVWDEAVRSMAKIEPRPKFVAYGPHVHKDLLEAARVAGCDVVLTKGQFTRDLQEILRTLGADS